MHICLFRSQVPSRKMQPALPYLIESEAESAAETLSSRHLGMWSTLCSAAVGPWGVRDPSCCRVWSRRASCPIHRGVHGQPGMQALQRCSHTAHMPPTPAVSAESHPLPHTWLHSQGTQVPASELYPSPPGHMCPQHRPPRRQRLPAGRQRHAHSRSRPGTQTSMQTCCSCPGDRQASLTPASGAPCFPQKRVEKQGHETGTNVKPQTCCPSSWPPASGKLVDQRTPDSSLPDVVIGTGMCRCAVVQLPGPSRPPPCSSEGRSQGVGEAYLPGQVHAGPVPLMQGMWPCTGQPGS